MLIHAGAEDYCPLVIEFNISVQVHDSTVHDQARDRDIPLSIYMPESEDFQAAPVILFSHGLGGSRQGGAYLGKHWAGRGYVAVFLQHVGSDESVWRDVPRARRMQVMRRAANVENYLLRVADVAAVLDQLDRWHNDAEHAFAGRMDLARVGMAGYSFGAQTTQALSGQRMPGGEASLSDKRITAALILSPSSPPQSTPQHAFGAVDRPWMLMTGTHDVARIGGADMVSRLAVFPALPEGDKYQVVLNKAEHSAFADHAMPGDQQPRNPNHHRVVQALSTAFWDSYLQENTAAKAWLQGSGPASVLDEKDCWQQK